MTLIRAEKYMLNRLYNVEYKLENETIETFSNILTNVDEKYFWFYSEEYGLDIIKQNRIETMVCQKN